MLNTSTVVGIVGYGAIADYHARAFKSLGVPIAAVAGPNASEAATFAARHKIPSTTSTIDGLLADRSISAVVIASATGLHAQQTLLALTAGMHVLCEIPLATSYDDAIRLGEVAERKGVRLMVAHTQRFQTPLRMLGDAVARGEVEPLQVVGRYMMYRHENRGWTGRKRSWTDDLLWHHGAHAVDTCIWLLNASQVSVEAHARPEVNDIGAPMDLTIAMRSASGGLAVASLSFNSRLPFNDYLVVGARTTLLATETKLVSPKADLWTSEDEDTVLADGVRAQAAEFIQSIADGRSPSTGVPAIAESMRVLQVAEAQIHTSSGRRAIGD